MGGRPLKSMRGYDVWSFESDSEEAAENVERVKVDYIYRKRFNESPHFNGIL